jgi:hypothetical protein
MAKMIEINLRPDTRTLRNFGFIAVAGFGFIAAIAWYEVLVFSVGLGAAREPVAITCLGVAALAGLCSIVYPKANLPLYLGLTVATYPIGFVLSYLIMGTLFYAIIAPIGLLLRGFGRDPLERRSSPSAETYWEDAPPRRPRESYFKQF